MLEGGELSASLPGCFTPLKNPSTYSMGAWVGPRADLDVLEKLEVFFPYQDLLRELSSPAHKLINIVTELSQLLNLMPEACYNITVPSMHMLSN